MSKTALVTGASGFIALHVVNQLLQDGWNVHATVRSLKNQAKIKPITDLGANARGSLELFEADLQKPGSFADAMQGCSVVFHVASPFLVPEQVKNPLKQLIEPAIEGTHNVLTTVNETPSVQRVILTSSVASIYGDAIDVHKTEDGTFRESDWNETSSTEHQEYAYSKVAAEREAWKMADAQDRWKLITICPALVVGPSLTASSSSGSLGLMQEIMGGHVFFGVPDLYFGIVDVREVATAHVKAAELPAARGRYIVSSSNSYSFVDCARAIRAFHKHPWLVPTWTVPNVVFWLVGPLFGVTRRFVKANVGTPFRLDNSRSIQELGLSYRPLEESLLNHYHQWLDDKKAK